MSSLSSFIYPTNNFGRHNNTNYYFYSRYVNQGNNWNGYGLHQVEIRNDTDSIIEVVGWKFKEGRLEEDFKTNVIRPGLFYTARLVPNSWGTYKSIIGAVTFKVQGTNQFYTLAFEDPFHDYIHNGFKGHIQEGNDADLAIANLKDHSVKVQPWGKYVFEEFDGRGKSVLTLTNPTNQNQSLGRSSYR
ncbi:unnamed protein product [Sphagnum balticum]